MNDSGESGIALTAETETILYDWTAREYVLTNPSVWFSIALAFGIGSLLLGVVISVATEGILGLVIGAGLFLGFMILFVVIGGAIDLFGGFRVRHLVTDRGVRSIAGKSARAAADAAIVGGMIAGNLSAISAGHAARREQSAFLPFDDIRRIKVSDLRRHILLKGSWGDTPIDLACTDDNFAQILSVIRTHCPAAH